MQVRLHRSVECQFMAAPRRQQKQLQEIANRFEEHGPRGQQVPRSQIPKKLRQRFGLTNLWRLELKDGWRAMYPLVTGPKEAIIIFLGDHNEYDRLMGY